MNYTVVTVFILVNLLLSIFTVVMAFLAAKHSRINSILLKTNSGKTIGKHIEQLQEDQIVLRDELSSIAQARLKADAILAAAQLEAIAKLASAADIKVLETAESTADDLRVKADETAKILSEVNKKGDPVLLAEAIKVKADVLAKKNK